MGECFVSLCMCAMKQVTNLPSFAPSVLQRFQHQRLRAHAHLQARLRAGNVVRPADSAQSVGTSAILQLLSGWAVARVGRLLRATHRVGSVVPERVARNGFAGEPPAAVAGRVAQQVSLLALRPCMRLKFRCL